MAGEKKTCKNHPQKEAKRVCHYCREPVCPQCQHHYAKHIFCGRWCYLRWETQRLLKQIKKQPQTAMQVALIGFSVLLLVFYFNFRISILEERLAERTVKTVNPITADSTAQTYSPFMSDSSRLAANNLLQFRLAVPPGAVVALERDGRFTTTFIAGDSLVDIAAQRLHGGKNRFALWMLDKGGHSTLIDSFTVYFNSARIDYLRRYVTHVSGVKKVLALTFDGGSLNDGTAEILDILKKTGIRCTIFLTGVFIKKYPDLVRRILADGHEIANHSYNHPHLTRLEIDGSNATLAEVDRAFLHNQLRQTDSLLRAVAGHSMAPFWRAPYGEINNDILLWAAEAGYKHIGWSQRCDTWDWVADTSSVLYRSNGQILDHVLSLEEKEGLDGKILLMHLGTERKSDFPYLMLEEMIGTLQGRGYRFVRISEMLKKAAEERMLSGR